MSPLYYIRICPPNLTYGKGHRKALLYTEPHYDGFEFPNKSYGIWVLLQKTTINTGTLSYIKKNDKIRKLFPNEGKIDLILKITLKNTLT